MRAAGATRGQTALAISLDGAVAVAGGTALAVAGAVAVSPLAPVGPVRAFDPARGLSADPLVLAAVFGASLNGLVTHPARYGWNWTLLMETEGGYGSWPPAQMESWSAASPGSRAGPPSRLPRYPSTIMRCRSWASPGIRARWSRPPPAATRSAGRTRSSWAP